MATGSRARGFTIIELMIAITIVGVMAAFAIPAFGDVIDNNRRTVIVNELLSNLMLARAEAAKTGSAVVICGATDTNNNRQFETSEQTCTGEDWRDGWIVALWNDADSDREIDSGELAIPAMKLYVSDYTEKVSILASELENGPAPEGAVALMPFNQTSTKGKVTICDKRGAAKARALELQSNGRARVLMNNVEDSVNGTALTC
jgi:type IV fimbrial biogenesis protein FimT